MPCLALLPAVLLLSCAVAAGNDTLEIGAEVREFHVKDVTGPAAGTELCYRCRYANRPVVSIFARRVDDELIALIEQVDETVGKNADHEMAGLFILMADDPAEHEDALKTLAEEHGITHLPLTIFNDAYGPRSYRLNREADVTVLMWVDGKLTVNQAFRNGQLTEETIAAVIRNTGKILKASAESAPADP